MSPRAWPSRAAGHGGRRAALRRLLRETPFAGAVSLSFEREPAFHLAAAIEGDRHQVVRRARRRDGRARLVGMAARSVREAFVNGAPARLGYLGPPARRQARGRGTDPRASAHGFDLLRRRPRRPARPVRPHERRARQPPRAPAPRGRRGGLPDLPAARRARDAGARAAAQAPRLAAGLALERGDAGRLWASWPRSSGRTGRAASSRRGHRGASSPRPSARAASRRRTSTSSSATGALVGCAAVWDQRGLQAGGRPRLRPAGSPPLRPLLRPLAPALGIPRLPAVGQRARRRLPRLPRGRRATTPRCSRRSSTRRWTTPAGAASDQLLARARRGHPLLRAARRRPHRPVPLDALRGPRTGRRRGGSGARRPPARPRGGDVMTFTGTVVEVPTLDGATRAGMLALLERALRRRAGARLRPSTSRRRTRRC